MRVKGAILLISAVFLMACTPTHVSKRLSDMRTATGIDNRHAVWQRRGVHIAPTTKSAVVYLHDGSDLYNDARYQAMTCKTFGRRLLNNNCRSFDIRENPLTWAHRNRVDTLYVVELNDVALKHRWWSPWFCLCTDGINKQTLRVGIFDGYSGLMLEQLIVTSKGGFIDDRSRLSIFETAVESALYTMAPHKQPQVTRWKSSL